ncbi:DUF4271 domain-containing protein [Peijinzhouia sedimentorum]
MSSATLKYILGTSVVFKHFFILMFGLIVSFNTSAQSDRIDVAPLVFDQGSQSYLPKPNSSLYDVLHYEINLAKHPYKEISIQQPSSFSVWINHQLIEKAGGKVRFSTDSLRNIYGANILLSVHSSNSLSRNLSVNIASAFQQQVVVEDKNLIAKEREQSRFPDFIGTGFVILLLLMALLRISYPKIFREYFNPAAVFFPRVSVDTLIMSRQFNPGTFLALLTFSFLVMFVLLVLLNWQIDLPPFLEFFSTSSYGLLMAILGIGFIVTFLIFLGKFVFLSVCSYLYGLEQFKAIHFFDYIRISSIIYMGVLLWILFNFFVLSAPIASSATIAFIAIIILFTVRIAIILIKLIRTANLRFSYLFSYLCTTEIIPLVVVLKLISVF